MNEKLFNVMRPQSLSDVKGHKAVTDKVRRWIKNDSIPSFILMHGCRGCGKTTVARIIAKVANCEHPTEEGPCGECESCIQASMGVNHDILELDAASKNKVEDVKALTDKLGYVPFFKKKVVILDEVHRLSATAFDSLLKTLEEPPESVIFIFCTTELQKIPDTIISRARKLEFPSLPTPIIVERLKEICEKYNKPYEETALLYIAKASGGAMRDAINNLEDFFDVGITEENVLSELGIAGEQAVLQMIKGICDQNWQQSVLGFRNEVAKGLRLQTFIDSVISVCLDVMQAKVTDSVKDIYGTDTYKEMVLATANAVSYVKVSEICGSFSGIRPIGLDATQIEGLIVSLLVEEGSVETLRKQVELLSEKVARLESGKVLSVKAEISSMESVPAPTNELPFEEEFNEFNEVSEVVPFDEDAPVADFAQSNEAETAAEVIEQDEEDVDDGVEEIESDCDNCPYIDECSGECILDQKNKSVEKGATEDSAEDEDSSEVSAPDADGFFSTFARLFGD